MIGCLPTQSLAFLAVFVYATHATQAIAFKWKPDFSRCVCADSRRVLNRMRQKLTAHEQLTSAAVAHFKTTVDHVTGFIGRFERHLADTLHTSWLTFPNSVLNLSLALEAGQTSGHYDSNVRTVKLANLLEIDEVQHIFLWTQRFWTRSDISSLFTLHLIVLLSQNHQ